MNYKVYKIERFKKEENKLSQEDRDRIDNIIRQLKENPYVGNQLQIRALREKRLKEKRMYYLVFDDLEAVLIIGISDKKTQQATIDEILKLIDDYRDYLKKLLGKN